MSSSIWIFQPVDKIFSLEPISTYSSSRFEYPFNPSISISRVMTGMSGNAIEVRDATSDAVRAARQTMTFASLLFSNTNTLARSHHRHQQSPMQWRKLYLLLYFATRCENTAIHREIESDRRSDEIRSSFQKREGGTREHEPKAFKELLEFQWSYNRHMRTAALKDTGSNEYLHPRTCPLLSPTEPRHGMSLHRAPPTLIIADHTILSPAEKERLLPEQNGSLCHCPLFAYHPNIHVYFHTHKYVFTHFLNDEECRESVYISSINDFSPNLFSTNSK